LLDGHLFRPFCSERRRSRKNGYLSRRFVSIAGLCRSRLLALILVPLLDVPRHGIGATRSEPWRHVDKALPHGRHLDAEVKRQRRQVLSVAQRHLQPRLLPLRRIQLARPLLEEWVAAMPALLVVADPAILGSGDEPAVQIAIDGIVRLQATAHRATEAHAR